MARPIAPTPVLRGKAAQKFIKEIEATKPYTPPTFDYKKMQEVVHGVLGKNEQK